MSFVAAAGIMNLDLIYAGLDALPQEGREVFAEQFSVQLGGGVVATMATLRALGVPTKAATYWGEDLFSNFAAAEIQKYGVEMHNLHVRSGGIPLSITSIAVTPRDRTFLSYIDWPEIDAEAEAKVYELFKGARVVEMQPGYLGAYRRLKAEGAQLVLDLGWDDDMSTQKYHEYLELADYFTPNRDEAMKITAAATPEEAAEKLRKYFDKVIVKLDSEGCLVLEEDKRYVVKSIPQYTRRDSTGAGDAFIAGLMYGIFHGRPLQEAVLYGNITGGNCVAQLGCLNKLLAERELLALANAHKHCIQML